MLVIEVNFNRGEILFSFLVFCHCSFDQIDFYCRHGTKVETLKPISEITEIWCSQSETSSQMSKSTRNNDAGEISLLVPNQQICVG